MNKIVCAKHGEQEAIEVSGELDCKACIEKSTVASNTCVACEG